MKNFKYLGPKLSSIRQPDNESTQGPDVAVFAETEPGPVSPELGDSYVLTQSPAIYGQSLKVTNMNQINHQFH